MTNSEEAEERYLDIARSLGWSESNNSSVVESDDDAGRSGGLFGTAVSTLAIPEDEDDGSLHFLALNTTSDDMSKIQQFLEQEPDVNAKDEFVRQSLVLL